MRSGVATEFDPFELQDTIQTDVVDPYPQLAVARRRGAVERGNPFDEPSDSSEEYYSVYTHDAVTEVLRDNQRFSSSIYGEIVGPVMGHSILEMDEPEHRLYRGLVAQAFRQKVLARWEADLVRAVVEELLDSIASGGHADLVRQLTFAAPVRVIARILGLPSKDLALFQRWSIELLSLGINWDRGLQAAAALRTYFADVLAERRRTPNDDLISELGAVTINGRGLEDEEVFAFLRLLLPAGVETTYRSTGNLLLGLLTHVDQYNRVAEDRDLIPTAVEEGLRWESPIVFIMRRAVKNCSVAGVDIPAGATINVSIGSANRDETRYVDPDRFDIDREPRAHVTFGSGPHVCLGMHLARMESRVIVEALVDRFPDLRLDPDVPCRIVGSSFRSPTALPVVFRRAR